MLKENKKRRNHKEHREEGSPCRTGGRWNLADRCGIAAESFAGTQQLPDQGKRKRA